MTTINEAAQLLISCWVIAENGESLPTSEGLLDAALYECVKAGDFPDWFRHKLRFTEDDLGVECVELGPMLDEAQTCKLTTAPNPTYTRTTVQATPFVAESMLLSLDVDEDAAKVWGRNLRAAVQRQIKAFEAAAAKRS